MGNSLRPATCNEYQQIFMSHTHTCIPLSLSSNFLDISPVSFSTVLWVFHPAGPCPREVANPPTVPDRDNDQCDVHNNHSHIPRLVSNSYASARLLSLSFPFSSPAHALSPVFFAFLATFPPSTVQSTVLISGYYKGQYHKQFLLYSYNIPIVQT